MIRQVLGEEGTNYTWVLERKTANSLKQKKGEADKSKIK
jgi:hypothetical protein